MFKQNLYRINLLKQNFEEKISTEKSEEKSLPKNPCRETCTENLRKVIIVQTNFEEKLFPKNI